MRVDDERARNYYREEAAQQQWSSRELERNIATMYYQRILSHKTEKTKLQPSSAVQNTNDFIKDPYVFEFLNIPEPLDGIEKEIESALISNLQNFLLELGKGFSFVGRQVRISTEMEHYYIDLVFYNYQLKCFVLFDIKTGKLTHQDIGQMDMYRRLFDEFKKPTEDNPTIGIILCSDKSETVVKYSIMSDTKRIFASKYLPYLPTEAELIEEIERDRQIIAKRAGL